MISCVGGKENKAAFEAIDLFNEAFEALNPEGVPETEQAEFNQDIASIIAGEVAELKDHNRKKFVFHGLGHPGLVYVEFQYTSGPSPADVLIWAFERAKVTKQSYSRLCTRFYPVHHVGQATIQDMDQLAKLVVEEDFMGEECIPFAVVDYRRGCKLDRMQIIDAFVNPIPQPPHKVNLNEAEKSIILNVVNNTIGVAVTKRYRELSKFNIRQVAQGDDN